MAAACRLSLHRCRGRKSNKHTSNQYRQEGADTGIQAMYQGPGSCISCAFGMHCGEEKTARPAGKRNQLT
ncbi:hypothetical protein QTP88_007780 [Uroleucon formosanum]